MVNPLYTSETLPTTSLAALREFSDRYVLALAASRAAGWADMLGELAQTNAPMLTYPVTQLRNKYERTLGETAARSLDEKSFDIKAEEFSDGYEARAYDLYKQVFAWRRWQQAPAGFVVAEERFRQRLIATALEAGATTLGFDGENFFDTDHPANLFDSSVGTFSNYQSVAADVTDLSKIEAESAAMQLVKDENGDKLGVKPDTILVPVEKYEKLNNLLSMNMIRDYTVAGGSAGASVSNPYVGRWNVIAIPEFTDVNDWYLVDSKLAKELSPWIIMRETVPPSLAMRTFDESSDFFKKSGKLRVESHIWYGSALGFPHAIRKVVGA